MSDATDRTAARAELVRLIQPDVAPCLTNTGSGNDIDAILDNNKRATTWTTGATVNVGDVLLPTVRNGRRYRATKAGVTGATEPSWPAWNSWYQNDPIARQVSDGTVTYQDDGADYRNIYDVRAACAEAAEVKMAKAVQYISQPGVNMQQLFEHCEKLRARFERVMIA